MLKLSMDSEPDDDPAFVAFVEKLIVGALAAGDTEHAAIIKIDNWFDDKWAAFGGQLRDYSGFAQYAFLPQYPVRRFSGKALPPFARSRVSYLLTIGQPEKNLASVFYFSGNTNANLRGSFLASEFDDSSCRYDWYVGFTKIEDWQMIRQKNISRSAVEAMAGYGT